MTDHLETVKGGCSYPYLLGTGWITLHEDQMCGSQMQGSCDGLVAKAIQQLHLFYLWKKAPVTVHFLNSLILTVKD